MGNVEYYKKEIINIREKIRREREAKKKDNENYARQIKSASSSFKAHYRKSKVDRAASHDREIANLKSALARVQYSLAMARKK